MTLFYSKECRRALLFTPIVEPNKVFFFTNRTDDVPEQSLTTAALSWPLNVFSHSTRDSLVDMKPLVGGSSPSTIFHGSFLAFQSSNNNFLDYSFNLFIEALLVTAY